MAVLLAAGSRPQHPSRSSFLFVTLHTGPSDTLVTECGGGGGLTFTLSPLHLRLFLSLSPPPAPPAPPPTCCASCKPLGHPSCLSVRPGGASRGEKLSGGWISFNTVISPVTLRSHTSSIFLAVAVTHGPLEEKVNTAALQTKKHPLYPIII